MAKFSRGNCQLQFLLDEQGITPAEFARLCGWSSRMVYHWCADERPMSVEALYNASMILEVPMEAFYNWIVKKDELAGRQ